jgi:hypothetical protein
MCPHDSMGLGFPFQSFFVQKRISTSIPNAKGRINMTTTITRDDFMAFFRDDESLNTLSLDDRIEVFSTIMLGACDFKKKLLDEIFSDYCVSHLEVIEIKE